MSSRTSFQLEERLPLDHRAGPCLVVQTGQLDDDAVVAHALHGRLGHAELVDPVAQDLLVLFGVLPPQLRRHRAVGVLHLEGEVHAALEVEPERDSIDPEHRRGGDDHGGDDQESAFQGAEHRRTHSDVGQATDRRPIHARPCNSAVPPPLPCPRQHALSVDSP
jgi:hypothetical protein